MNATDTLNQLEDSAHKGFKQKNNQSKANAWKTRGNKG